MSGGLSSVAEWYTRLEPVRRPEDLFVRADDPRLGEIVLFWQREEVALLPGQAVLIGFPHDEGVRRNHGRPGAAEAPQEIRRWLYRLTVADCQSGVALGQPAPLEQKKGTVPLSSNGQSPFSVLDLGNIKAAGDLESTQAALGEVVAAVLRTGASPIVLGGGHETAYGHFLGYVAAQQPVGIVNLDAHLDVRPYRPGHGHSGSPFRQAMEHPSQPLHGSHYSCLGAQPHSVSRPHWQYVLERGGVIRWCAEVRGSLASHLKSECDRLAALGCKVYVTLDADAVQVADVPGVSATNPAGLAGWEVLACARLAGSLSHVASLDLVEINPRYDHDGRSARWAALAIWNFLIGLAMRQKS